MKKKIFSLKVKLFFTIFLPFFIILIFAKAADTFIQIQIRKIFTSPFDENEKEFL